MIIVVSLLVLLEFDVDGCPWLQNIDGEWLLVVEYVMWRLLPLRPSFIELISIPQAVCSIYPLTLPSQRSPQREKNNLRHFREDSTSLDCFSGQEPGSQLGLQQRENIIALVILSGRHRE